MIPFVRMACARLTRVLSMAHAPNDFVFVPCAQFIDKITDYSLLRHCLTLFPNYVMGSVWNGSGVGWGLVGDRFGIGLGAVWSWFGIGLSSFEIGLGSA